jgi:uncharacterized membrane protein (UPF0127 family)
MRAVLIALMLLGLAAAGPGPALAQGGMAQRGNAVLPAVLGEARLELEMAETPAARYQGLSGRQGLAPGRGMALAYPYPGRWGMVMRGMLFPLDFVWVRGGAVVGVTAQVPPPRPGETPIEVGPPADVDMVLELPAGWAAAHGVGKGARLTLSSRP